MSANVLPKVVKGGRVGKHTHKYERYFLGDKKHMIYRCMIPDCSHFLPNKELLPGRKSICWKCGSEMLLHKQHVGVQKPICEKCHNQRSIEQIAANLRRKIGTA